MGANIGYIRVSSLDQHAERQLADCKLEKVFEDRASGKDTNRPQLHACLDFSREGDVLHVHSIDRLARNLENMQSIVRKFMDKGVSVYFVKENLRFHGGETSPMQDLLFHVLASFAQFERAMIRERQREGIAAAKREGRKLGRKKALTPEQERELCASATAGAKKKELAVRYGVSRPTVYRILQQSA